MAPATKNSKPIFKTASPFTETTWPQISHDNQDVILALVCNLISPIGDHRKQHIHPSKGKKRKRKSKEDGATQDDAPPPPPPEIGKHILVGINSITRHLEALAAQTAPPAMPGAEARPNKEREQPRPISTLLVTHPKPSMSPAHAHLPTLLHLSTLASATSTSSTRLVPLSTATDARLAAALHIPRVGALAIFADAPGAKALEEFVQEKVGLTECQWVDEAMSAKWKGVNVQTELSVGKKK
ncbi:hypothetical protein DE146DRAFT_646688 [Phaeosphaeria sp. MPI-PUGE-AT-0046c]|nr:hypothetical protein DE146DRAFT_646688 [Phaeosphaeria sp. MPI-PUGE-AT-0046c]